MTTPAVELWDRRRARLDQARAAYQVAIKMEDANRPGHPGYDATHACVDRAMVVYERALRALMRTPAPTIADAAEKLRLAMDEELPSAALAPLLRDLTTFSRG